MIFGPFDAVVSEVAKVLSKPEDQSRMLMIFFLAYPIALVFKYIPGKWPRHAYSILMGVFLHVFMFRWEVFHFYALGLTVWLIMTLMNRQTQPWVVFTVCLVHCSVMHIKRVLFDYGGWSLDCTTFLMPLISRLSSLGFVYADGDSKKKEENTPEQEERKIVDKPTIIEILSYISYPGANMCGPF